MPLSPEEEKLERQKAQEIRRVRRVIADTYTFVRGQEINRTLGGYTFDHYLEEGKRQIKGATTVIGGIEQQGRALRGSSGEAFGVRPSKLDALDSLEDEFRATLETAKTMAKAADATTDENETEDE